MSYNHWYLSHINCALVNEFNNSDRHVTITVHSSTTFIRSSCNLVMQELVSREGHIVGLKCRICIIRYHDSLSNWMPLILDQLALFIVSMPSLCWLKCIDLGGTCSGTLYCSWLFCVFSTFYYRIVCRFHYAYVLHIELHNDESNYIKNYCTYAMMNLIINRLIYTATCGTYATCECCLLSKQYSHARLAEPRI